MAARKIFSLFVLVLIHLIYSSDADKSSLPPCAPGQNYFLLNNTCVDETTDGSRPFCKNVTIFKDDSLPGNLSEYYKTDDDYVTICYPFSAQFMRCQRWLYTADEYEIRGKSQTLYLLNGGKTYSLDEYALRKGEEGPEAVVCVKETTAQETEKLNNIVYIYSAAWIISIISLAIAFVLCISVPGLTTYRAVMPCYVGSLFVSYIILVVRGLGSPPSSLLCYSYGVGLQFSFLAAFFWLNVIAFDLWRSVSTPVISPGPLRLLAYMTYGWGCPLLFVGTAVAFDKIKDLQISSTFRPQFEQECWFHGTEARFAFFYGPISAILIINLIFFISTLFAVRSKVVSQEVEKNHSLWRLSIELAIIMGLCWIMEVVSWAVGGDASYWYATDIINALQGLFVLIVIARRPNVTSWLKQSFGRTTTKDPEEGSTFSYVQPENKY